MHYADCYNLVRGTEAPACFEGLLISCPTKNETDRVVGVSWSIVLQKVFGGYKDCAILIGPIEKPRNKISTILRNTLQVGTLGVSTTLGFGLAFFILGAFIITILTTAPALAKQNMPY